MDNKTLFKCLVVLGALIFVFLNYWFLRRPDHTPFKTFAKDFPTKMYLSETTSSPVIQQNLADKGNDSIAHVDRENVNIVSSSSSTPKNVPPISKIPDNISVWKNRDRGIHVYGSIIAGTKYSVVSSTTHNTQSINYLFDLPLTALAWKRVGFRTIVIMVVSSGSLPDTDSKIRFVLSTLLELQCVVIFLETHPSSAVMISQVSRLFVSHLLDSHSIDDMSRWEETYLITSDADLWPLKNNSYRLPKKMDIISFNAHCCGNFIHKGDAYFMLPIANIGMKVNTWLSVTRRHGFVPFSVNDLITYFAREFGDVAMSSVEKGENLGWFMDQRMISVLIQDWASRGDNSAKVLYVSRDTGKDRIDRSNWKPFSIEGMMDSHILESAYEPRIWHRLEALLVLMYERDTFSWCQRYAAKFLTL